MEQTLSIVTPVFAVMALGWLFARKKLITEAGTTGIVNFIFYLSIPAVIFRTLASGAVQSHFTPAIVFAYFTAALPHFALCWWVARRFFHHPKDTAAVAGMSGTFSNLVLIGLPLVQRAYGDQGLVPLMLIVMVHSPILFTVSTLSLSFGQQNGSGQSALRTVAHSLKSVLLNPIVLAALSGLAYGFVGPKLPMMVDETLEMLAKAAAPASLFAVGASLAQSRLRGDLREALVFATLKITVLPVGVWLLARFVFAVPPQWITIAILAAAMPAGANAYVFACKYDRYIPQATAIVVLSTLLSVVTLTALIALLPPL